MTKSTLFYSNKKGQKVELCSMVLRTALFVHYIALILLSSVFDMCKFCNICLHRFYSKVFVL